MGEKNVITNVERSKERAIGVEVKACAALKNLAGMIPVMDVMGHLVARRSMSVFFSQVRYCLKFTKNNINNINIYFRLPVFVPNSVGNHMLLLSNWSLVLLPS